jgi:predicted nucleotide-binding protein
MSESATMSGDKISAKGQQERFAQWNKIGVERIKHDLLNGGYRLVGGPLHEQELAWEWVRSKEKEQAMAKRTPEQKRPAQLTNQQKSDAIRRIEQRIAELRALNIDDITRGNDARITVLENKLDRLLVDTFGADTLDYDRYGDIQRLDRSTYSIAGPLDPMEIQQGVREGVTYAIAELEAIADDFRADLQTQSAHVETSTAPLPKKVFVVHGHDDGTRESVARFVEKLGFEAIILHERANRGRTIITKFREEAEGVGFAVVLMTPDDVGKAKSSPDLNPRARQNVVFELGFFIGALRPERVAALVRGNIERPSDFDGVVYISLDQADWRTRLGTELKAAGFNVDWNKVMS